MINKITDDEVNEVVRIKLPCIEGTGFYPKVDPRTFQHKEIPNIYFAGDIVGHTRGLLQGFVMGDMAAKSMQNNILDKELHSRDLLKDYQSIDLPVMTYNKFIMTQKLTGNDVQTMKDKMSQILIETVKCESNETFKDIFDNMDRVKFVGNLESLGVVYELHHFFLDKKVLDDTQQLHYITRETMLQYITLCNVIDENKMIILDSVIKGISSDEIFIENITDITRGLRDTFKNHMYKSCVLALRTRESIEKRDDYTDIPVMQPAFKIQPISKRIYSKVGEHNFSKLKDLQIKIVASTAALLDTFYKDCINKLGLGVSYARTKIESQEPKIEMVDSSLNPKYLECHVKVNIKNKDNTPAEYYSKKNVIQELATLFEGENATIYQIFKALGVSINLLKHPEHGQQFFLTFRADTKEEMRFIRTRFNKIMNISLQVIPSDSVLNMYNFTFYTDSEFVIYDNNRGLDLPWFPITKDFMNTEYKNIIDRFTLAKKHIFIITGNSNKIEELNRIVDPSICLMQYNIKEEQYNNDPFNMKTFVYNRAKLAYSKIKHPLIVECTGLEKLDACSFPGASTGTLIDNIGMKNFIQIMTGTCSVHTHVVYYDGLNDKAIFRSKNLLGNIIPSKMGENGFGWDGYFIPEGNSKTFGLMNKQEKDNMSTRKTAITMLIDCIKKE